MQALGKGEINRKENEMGTKSQSQELDSKQGREGEHHCRIHRGQIQDLLVGSQRAPASTRRQTAGSGPGLSTKRNRGRMQGLQQSGRGNRDNSTEESPNKAGQRGHGCSLSPANSSRSSDSATDTRSFS